MPEVTYRPIGIVHSPYRDPAGTPIQSKANQENTAVIEIYPEYQEGLKDLDGFSHVFVLSHLHLAGGRPLTVIPFMDTKPHGVFATRSPARPNPIGLSVVLLERISGNMLTIKQMDILDGTPVLDIKPYIMQFDVFETTRNGWMEDHVHKLAQQKDDGRFIKK